MQIGGQVEVPLRYEFPLNERVRLLLRLEETLRRVAEAAYESSPDAHRYALVSLCELIELTTRIDLKAEVRSEAERQRGQLRALRGLPDIDEAALDRAIGELEQVIERINGSSHRAGARCRDDGWLSMVRARVGVPGGVTRFDMPSVNYWLALDPASRRDRLIGWLNDFECVNDGVGSVLRLLRACADNRSEQARGGQFQRALGARLPIMVAIDLPPGLDVIPELSANRTTLLVRFLQFAEGGRPRPLDGDVAFGLAVTYAS